MLGGVLLDVPPDPRRRSTVPFTLSLPDKDHAVLWRAEITGEEEHAIVGGLAASDHGEQTQVELDNPSLSVNADHRKRRAFLAVDIAVVSNTMVVTPDVRCLLAFV